MRHRCAMPTHLIGRKGGLLTVGISSGKNRNNVTKRTGSVGVTYGKGSMSLTNG